MTLTQIARAGAITLLVVSFAALIFFGGNQRLAFADPLENLDGLANNIICEVYTDINDEGDPLPHLPTENDCRNIPEASAQCQDGIDNDNDGFVDSADPSCHTDHDPTNSASYNPDGSEELGVLVACWNGIDDDGDGKTDFPDDLGCSSATDTDEADPSGGSGAENTLALCTDGTDNDGDSKVDLEDSDCASFRPTLTVTLVVTNDNGGTSDTSDFSLSVNMSSPGFSESIGIASGVETALTAEGTWTLEGVQKTGYSSTFSGDCNSAGEVTLAVGETKTCTITSDDVAPTSGGGGSIGGGGGGSGGSAIAQQAPGYSGPSGEVLGAATEQATSCDQYLTAFIRSGQENDPEQVRRLQTVLRDFEGATNIEVTGIYDEATLAAIHALQSKYASEILTPWGIGNSTGYVYLTTRKKINEINCRNTTSFPLTEEEQNKIEQIRDRVLQESVAQVADPVIPSEVADPTSRFLVPIISVLGGGTSSESLTEEGGEATSTEPSPANLWNTFRGIFRGLFGR